VEKAWWKRNRYGGNETPAILWGRLFSQGLSNELKIHVSLLFPEYIVRKYFKQAIALISFCSKIKNLFHGLLNKYF